MYSGSKAIYALNASVIVWMQYFAQLLIVGDEKKHVYDKYHHINVFKSCEINSASLSLNSLVI